MTEMLGHWQCPQPAEEKPKRWWKRTFQIWKGRFYITFSNCRVKKRPTACNHDCTHRLGDIMREIKAYRYKQNDGLCPECGKPYDISVMELHHVLPWSRFPEMRARKANMVLLCHRCHKEVHCNPWKNIQMMQKKAAELDVDLKERYEQEFNPYNEKPCH
jgi:5-methylcytosine-specific restriction endonuclease McrA